MRANCLRKAGPAWQGMLFDVIGLRSTNHFEFFVFAVTAIRFCQFPVESQSHSSQAGTMLFDVIGLRSTNQCEFYVFAVTAIRFCQFLVESHLISFHRLNTCPRTDNTKVLGSSVACRHWSNNFLIRCQSDRNNTIGDLREIMRMFR